MSEIKKAIETAQWQSENSYNSEETRNVYKTILMVLERQFAQKPINKGQYETCPSCDNCLPASKLAVFCSKCGQRLERK